MGNYRYTSNKRSDDQTERIILEGSSSDPTRYVDIGGEIELSDEERQRLGAYHRLVEVDEQSRSASGTELPDDKKSEESKSEEKPASGRGRTQ